MNLQELTKLTGQLTITKRNPKGIIVLERTVPNLVVSTGKSYVASRMIGTSSSVMSHMAVGTSSVAPLPADATLGTEIGRVALTSATSLNNTASFTATFFPGTGTGIWSEAGIFNNSSAGIMLCRTTFSSITKSSGDTIAISWDITLS